MVFAEKPVAKISATITGTTDVLTIDGVTPSDQITPEDAKAQLDKVLDVVGKSVNTVGMKQIITREAANNG